MKTLFRLQYELPAYTEEGTSNGAKLDLHEIEDEGVRECLSQTAKLGHKELMKWLKDRPNDELVAAIPLTTVTPEALAYRLEGRRPKLVYIQRPLHTIQLLDELLAELNNHVDNGAIICCHSMTSRLKKAIIESRYPWVLRKVLVALHYLWHRVCPKLKLTRWLYFGLTSGKNRTFNRVEVMGRICRAGFIIIDEEFRDGEFFITARKMRPPVLDMAPSGSPIIHLKRVGKDGKRIVVHKFRTMYSYSEYIQSYIFEHQHLNTGGKFKDDYRINFWGRLLRRTWLDELPMVWNILRGDMKLVGVRPLSEQYFSLYSPEMQQLRTRTKPGLLPPFYYDQHTPETIDEVQESERRYLEAYQEKPFATDWRYFWGIIGNILFHKKHSA